MQDPFFFGYGSLVNRATHGYRDAVRARISGWRRVWRHTPLRPVAYLTAKPAPGVTLDGLVAAVPGGDWTALDQREYAYDRHAVGKVVDHGLAARIDVHVYAIPEGLHSTHGKGAPGAPPSSICGTAPARQPRHCAHRQPIVSAAPPRHPILFGGRCPLLRAHPSAVACSRSPSFSILNRNSLQMGNP
ncbi:gamma-glutamylcyclotransferase family protein [Rhodovulum sulfidophilum]|uniref:gamma-glutamylcyclotransferase family protein n=1 Tax=Rhodovulum sulfidophilum TaxID=35806 RepID=UPI001389D4BF|nr:gamma-glutamylcyclotransferase family protein [Rhodovulum sulfidophilum]NDK33898.1 gamma-glutamylcyclotransferase [Rhodovulum sulfidophilum]